MWRSRTSLIELPTSTSTTQTCWTYKVLKSTAESPSASNGSACSAAAPAFSEPAKSCRLRSGPLEIYWSVDQPAQWLLVTTPSDRPARQREYSSVCCFWYPAELTGSNRSLKHVVIPVSSRNICGVRKSHFVLFLLFKCRKQTGISLESRRTDHIWTAVVW